MNDLQKYLKLRGACMKTIARTVGLNYHSVQKTVQGKRHSSHVKLAVARELGVDPLLLWSDDPQDVKTLISQEIDRRADAERARLRASFLRSPARIPNNNSGRNA